MLVIVSWVSFWLDQSAVPARVSLGVTTLLTMATQTSGINQTLPPVSYTKVRPFTYDVKISLKNTAFFCGINLALFYQQWRSISVYSQILVKLISIDRKFN